MKFTGISRDPNGVYIATSSNGWLWRWVPEMLTWLTLWTDDDEENTNGPGSHN